MFPQTQSLCYPRRLSVDCSPFAPRPAPVIVPPLTLLRPRRILAVLGMSRTARKDYGRQPLNALELPARLE